MMNNCGNHSNGQQRSVEHQLRMSSLMLLIRCTVICFIDCATPEQRNSSEGNLKRTWPQVVETDQSPRDNLKTFSVAKKR